MADWHRIKRWLLAHDWPFYALAGVVVWMLVYALLGCAPAPAEPEPMCLPVCGQQSDLTVCQAPGERCLVL